MVQLAILTGKTAGSLSTARRFPFRIGRARDADLRLEEAGVWDYHARLELEPGLGFMIEADPNALVSVNGQAAQHVALRNGDLIEFGSVKARFWLAPARQRPLIPREALVWLVVGGVSLAQLVLIYWMHQ